MCEYVSSSPVVWIGYEMLVAFLGFPYLIGISVGFSFNFFIAFSGIWTFEEPTLEIITEEGELFAVLNTDILKDRMLCCMGFWGGSGNEVWDL